MLKLNRKEAEQLGLNGPDSPSDCPEATPGAAPAGTLLILLRAFWVVLLGLTIYFSCIREYE